MSCGESRARFWLNFVIIMGHMFSWVVMLISTRRPMVNPLYTLYMALVASQCIHSGMEMACASYRIQGEPSCQRSSFLSERPFLVAIGAVSFMTFAVLAPGIVIVIMCNLLDKKKPSVASKRIIFGLVVGILVLPSLGSYWPYCYPRAEASADQWRRWFDDRAAIMATLRVYSSVFYCISSCSNVTTACLAWSIYVIAGVSVIYILIWIRHVSRWKLASIVRLAERAYEKLVNAKEPIPTIDTVAPRLPNPCVEDHDGLDAMRSQRLDQFAKISAGLLLYSAVFALVIVHRDAIGDRMWIATIVHTFVMCVIVPILSGRIERGVGGVESEDGKSSTNGKKASDSSADVATTMGSTGRSPPVASLVERLAEKKDESDDTDDDFL